MGKITKINIQLYGAKILTGMMTGSDISKLRTAYEDASIKEIEDFIQALKQDGLSGENLRIFVCLLMASEAKEKKQDIFRSYTVATGFLAYYIEQAGFGKDILQKLNVAKSPSDLLNDFLVPDALIDLYEFEILDLLRNHDKRMHESPDRAVGMHLLILLRHVVNKQLLLSDLTVTAQHLCTVRFSQLMPLQSYSVREFDYSSSEIDEFDLFVLQVGAQVLAKCEDLSKLAPLPPVTSSPTSLFAEIAGFHRNSLRNKEQQTPLAAKPIEVAQDPRHELVLKLKEGGDGIQLAHIEVPERVLVESDPLLASLKRDNRSSLRITVPNIKPLSPTLVNKIFAVFDKDIYRMLENILRDLINAPKGSFDEQMRQFKAMLMTTKLNVAEIETAIVGARAVNKAEHGQSAQAALADAIPYDPSNANHDDDYDPEWDDGCDMTAASPACKS